MANIERNRRYITEHSLTIPDPAQISRELRAQFSANPLKMTSIAVIAGIATTAFLRNPSRKRTRATGKIKSICRLIDWLIHKAGNPHKNQSGVSAPFAGRLVSAIREIFK